MVRRAQEDCAVQSTVPRAVRWINTAKMAVVGSKSEWELFRKANPN